MLSLDIEMINKLASSIISMKFKIRININIVVTNGIIILQHESQLSTHLLNTNNVNRVSSFFPKGDHSSSLIKPNIIVLINRDVNITATNIQARYNNNRTTALKRSVINCWSLKPRPKFLKWFKTFTSHDNPPTRL